MRRFFIFLALIIAAVAFTWFLDYSPRTVSPEVQRVVDSTLDDTSLLDHSELKPDSCISISDTSTKLTTTAFPHRK